MMDLAELARVKRRSKEKKIQIPKPELFDGVRDSSLTYKAWYETVHRYLRFHQGTWDDDTDLITIVGAFMKGKAREWFDNRSRKLRRNRKVDTFTAFVEAMSEQYKHDKERDVQFEKLHQLQYSGNIFEYINKLEALNMRVGLSGFPWRKAIKRGLSQELRKQLAQVPGGEPDEDDPLIAKLKEIGYAHEEFLAEEKAMGHSVIGNRSTEKAKGQ